MKKIWLFLVLIVLAAAVLTGCAGSADTLPTPTPGTSANPGMMSPARPTAAPEASEAPSAIRTVEDARKAAEEMEDAIEKLSEVDEADVALAGDTALVGLKLTGQYQGQVDDRLKKMVLTRVQTVEKSIAKAAGQRRFRFHRDLHRLQENNLFGFHIFTDPFDFHSAPSHRFSGLV